MDIDLKWLKAKEDLAAKLFDWGVIKFGAFKLKLHEKTPDAPLSPIFVNLRTPDNPKPGPLTPGMVKEISQYLFWRSRMLKLPCEYVAGIPRAGDPFANEFHNIYKAAFPLPIGLIRLHKEETESGRQITGLGAVYEGMIGGGTDVLLLDDLVTKAGSKFEAIEVLEKNGFTVRHILVMIDRYQGGRQDLKRRGYTLHSIFTLPWLIDYYRKFELIDQAKYEEVKAYLKTNA